LIDDLWPEGADEESAAISYLRGRLSQDSLRQAAALRLAPDLGAECAASLQTDWDWHYRFAYALMAPMIFNPEDPAQWFVDLGINQYPEKARDVLANIAIIERRQDAMASLLPEQATPFQIDSLAYEWIKIQITPGWELARWVMQMAIGLREANQYGKATSLVKQLPAESLQLLHRYAVALELVIAASKQAALEAIDRPV
jgi:hypothetical protein